MKELEEKGFLSTTTLQNEDVDLGWKDEIEVEEDNILISYNPVKAMSNNVTVKAIQEGSDYPDFKAVLEEYKNIQFENMKELGWTNVI